MKKRIALTAHGFHGMCDSSEGFDQNRENQDQFEELLLHP
jgi:hypothetical protein